ncbi:hypothetical protein QL285_052732 [Trifolium repens]|nr:hypothetical protein QL285_052732 [Trifolium repens]
MIPSLLQSILSLLPSVLSSSSSSPSIPTAVLQTIPSIDERNPNHPKTQESKLLKRRLGLMYALNKLLHCLLRRHWRRRVCSAKLPHKNAFFNQFPIMAHATASLLCPATTECARCNAVHHHRV